MAESNPTDTPTLSAIPSAIASAISSAAATPQSLGPMDPEERAKSLHVSLADLTAKANALYAQKKYEEAAEIFSQATEMQAEINGEMAPENADILFLYGRALFKVGQSKSDVLGGKPTADKSNGAADKKPKAKKSQAQPSTASATKEEEKTEEGVAIVAKNAPESGSKDGEKIPDAKKPLFQFTGDEDFEDSDEEQEAEEGEGEEEEDDDLAVAFEILDLARVLFEKSLEHQDQDNSEGKGKEKAEESPAIKHIKERLADTHDLLAEISLENEKYPLAVNDCRSSLRYKEELYSSDSEILAEAFFKLSLALEFASVTTAAEDNADAGAEPKPVDEGLRKEAADALEKAIASTKLKLDAKEVDLAMLHAPEDNDLTRKQITEVKELIADMEQRLIELKKPPMDINSVLAADDGVFGVLGAALGESATDKGARLEEAKKNAKDVSGLVRKKTKEEEPKPETETKETNGKRKAEDPAPGDDEAKKAKVEESAES
ncbi:hypothetical protein GGR54DRAFT_653948 [Hypoxylon sp. NC1633]|nr:hypothetical protein GGR54DRAFT_653948 [Hypoxylon sp. NC1633]